MNPTRPSRALEPERWAEDVVPRANSPDPSAQNPRRPGVRFATEPCRCGLHRRSAQPHLPGFRSSRLACGSTLPVGADSPDLHARWCRASSAGESSRQPPNICPAKPSAHLPKTGNPRVKRQNVGLPAPRQSALRHDRSTRDPPGWSRTSYPAVPGRRYNSSPLTPPGKAGPLQESREELDVDWGDFAGKGAARS